jgi:hypothetical protein
MSCGKFFVAVLLRFSFFDGREKAIDGLISNCLQYVASVDSG